MNFLRARTKEQIEQRQLDIMQACETLFEKGGYDHVNIMAISEMTSITRSAIYTYYKTKDEIILDLLHEELLDWKEELLEWTLETAPLNKAEFCKQFTAILMSKHKMLHYYSLLYTLLELNCRLEKLVAFKQDVIPVLGIIVKTIKENFSFYTQEQASIITEEIVSYILGLYPATHLTPKQKDAIILSKTGYQAPDFAQLCEMGINSFLSDSHTISNVLSSNQ